MLVFLNNFTFVHASSLVNLNLLSVIFLKEKVLQLASVCMAFYTSSLASYLVYYYCLLFLNYFACTNSFLSRDKLLHGLRKQADSASEPTRSQPALSAVLCLKIDFP